MIFTRFPLTSAWGGEEEIHILMMEHFKKSEPTIFIGSCQQMYHGCKRKKIPAAFLWFFGDITSKWTLLLSLFTLPILFGFGIIILPLLKLKGHKKILMMSFQEKIAWTPLTKVLGIKTYWGHHAPLGNWFFKNPFLPLWKYLSSFVTIITPSLFLGSELMKAKKNINLTVIPNPLLPEKSFFDLPIKKPNSVIKIGFAGRLSTEKGVDTLIHAIEGIENIELHIAGEGVEKKNLEAQVSGIPNTKIIFHGFLNTQEMKSFWEIIDICVIPSRKEPFGIVLLEAMSSGKPVITTGVDGIKEVVSLSAIFFPVDDHNALRQKIQQLIGNPQILEKYQLEGRKQAKKFADINLFYKRMKHI